GGEPLVRKNVLTLFESLGRHLKTGALDELTLTTNGTRLPQFADALRAAGVRRVNISLDSLDRERFKSITRWGDLSKTMDGIRAAKDAGLKVKINTVAMRGVNEDELNDMVDWCGQEGFDLVFIETMPMGDIDGDRTAQYLPLSLVRTRLAERWTLTAISDDTGGPARYARCEETGGRVGFITPMSHNFCESCNRVRLTCTGTLYMCLGQEDAADLRAPLRASEGNGLLMDAIQEAIARKPKGHDFIIDRRHNRPAVQRHMNVTGG
ncbi:MAG: GTP 3',8-cyclase MoaA, partial [Rhodospirillaceae bacterium]